MSTVEHAFDQRGEATMRSFPAALSPAFTRYSQPCNDVHIWPFLEHSSGLPNILEASR